MVLSWMRSLKRVARYVALWSLVVPAAAGCRTPPTDLASDSGMNDSAAHDAGGASDLASPLLVVPPEFRASSEKAAATIMAAYLQQHLTALASDVMEGRNNLTAGGQMARDYLIQELAAIGAKPSGSSEQWSQVFDKGTNILAELPGRDPALAGEYILLGAHYDHLGRCAKGAADGDEICNGATDNASGAVAVLAIAKALSASEQGTRRSILLALWDAEEDGLLGSRHYAEKDALVPLASITASVNLDVIGSTAVPGVSASFALGAEYTSGIRSVIYRNSETLGYLVHPVSSFFDGSATGRRSDHLPFREKGVPVVWYSSGAPAEYHLPSDEIAIVNWNKLLLATRHALLTVADLANADGRPGYVAQPEPHIDDAVALVDIGEVILADPAAAGLTDPALSPILELWIANLKDYVAKPPTTPAGWQEYQDYVKAIIEAVYQFLPKRL
jgi:hypothetical protein